MADFFSQQPRRPVQQAPQAPSLGRPSGPSPQRPIFGGGGPGLGELSIKEINNLGLPSGARDRLRAGAIAARPQSIQDLFRLLGQRDAELPGLRPVASRSLAADAVGNAEMTRNLLALARLLGPNQAAQALLSTNPRFTAQIPL